ncbi:helix-turn-helix domain-containing protein [Sporosarcina limicola]|uniref:Transcriptional regulator with XRE-family HTH domain n=1 Tax=Sporosarcina limicola TaxID=34101 RepID=A0A927MKY1_9BACL|nr:helix-turn-helix transcriptional regulator [Sporosarcina limicola]MBE1554847.1 transcriptional regulator with XRE-family HTH domain [Sporosarcina limicola]
MSSLYEEIGERVQQSLEQNNTSKIDFARKVGVSAEVMSKIIQGKKAINVVEMQRIADELAITMEELVGTVQELEKTANPMLL